jgi:predicted nuclease with TOPRIM domain
MSEQNLQDRVAELELQLEEANQKLAASEGETSNLKQQLEASQNDTRIQVEARGSDAQRISELENQLEAANAEMLKLQDKNSKYENPSFTYGGSQYEILAKNANVPGHGFVSAADIAGSTELQEWLVSRQSGLIRKKA